MKKKDKFDFLKKKCQVDSADEHGLALCAFKPEAFPDYKGKLYFMKDPTDGGMALTAKIQEDDFIKNCISKYGSLFSSEEAFDKYIREIFDYAINNLKFKSFYAFETKQTITDILRNDGEVEMPEHPTIQTIYLIRGRH